MHVDDQGTELCKNGCPVSATLADGRPREARVYVHHREGHRVPVLVRTYPVRSETGEIEGVIETFTDNAALLDALRQVEELSLQTETDPLTEVGNRRSMVARLDSRVSGKRRSKAGYGHAGQLG